MDLIEQQMPGFLDPAPDGKPKNKLIVTFTDWDHSGMGRDHAHAQTVRALCAGVNIVTIAPRSYTPYRSMLPEIQREAAGAPGVTTLTVFDSHFPSQVWDEAAKALAQ
jgi:hypothetical protein